MNAEQIMNMELVELISPTNIYEIQSEPEEMREALRSVYIARLDELDASKELKAQIIKTFKAFEEADKELSRQYTKENNERNGIGLTFDGHGKPMSTIDNFLLILREDEHFKGLKFNLLTHAPETVEDGKTCKWQDRHDSEARLYIEKKYCLHNEKKLDDALKVLFAEREYHPIKDIIEHVKWDGKERIQTLFIKWLKCDDTPYTREVTRLVFAGGIHRLYNTGCKFDDVAVLVGTSQGEGKSTFARWLAIRDEFFTEVTEIEGQKGIEAVEGTWICELGELLAVTKAREVEAVKSYISKLVDHYRRPFDKRTTDVPRQCIFIGTTNKAQFLTDKTGNRRWYPLKVNCSGYDLFNHEAEIKEDILQAWAEAKILYDKGSLKPYANSMLQETIRRQQNKAVEDDYRVGMIEKYLEKRNRVCIVELWQRALDNPFSKPTRKESNDIALILQGIPNWERSGAERHEDYGVQMFWRRKEGDEPCPF